MEFKAKADKESSSSEVKYSFFAGRWQPLHKGHLWLINERLKEGYNVWLVDFYINRNIIHYNEESAYSFRGFTPVHGKSIKRIII